MTYKEPKPGDYFRIAFYEAKLGCDALAKIKNDEKSWPRQIQKRTDKTIISEHPIRKGPSYWSLTRFRAGQVKVVCPVCKELKCLAFDP